VFAAIAISAAVLGLSVLVLSSWTKLRSATAPEASSAFDTALAEMVSRSPYLEISQEGTVQVHRELEQPEPADLDVLHVLTWEPATTRLLQLDFPFWFVRLKMSRTLNLGTLASVLVHDWGSFDLSVTEDDLARRGPGLVLDTTRADGSRMLLWTD
jgi:hypothetical protein